MRHLGLKTAADDYIRYLYSTKAKDRKTVAKEDYSLARWCESLPDLRLTSIKLSHLREFASERAETGVSNRTINLDIIALGNLLRHFQTDPTKPVITDHWTPLKHVTPRRVLMPEGTLEKLCEEATSFRTDGEPKYPNGVLLSNLLKLLAYSGARKSAALSALWSRVDWANEQITFQTKFAKFVTVDFNPALKKLLTDMHSLRDEDNDFIFPSPVQAGSWTSPDDLFAEVREATGLTEITFHDFRHAFISRAVMAGVDILTVARWVGHADGGVLIGKVYGHLNNRHLKDSAAKLTNL